MARQPSTSNRFLSLLSALMLLLAMGLLFGAGKHLDLNLADEARYRYRFRVGNQSKSLEASLAFYEDRSRKFPDSALVLAELADLNRKMARRAPSADRPALLQKAFKQATLSLEKLPQFNVKAQLVLAQLAFDRHEFNKAAENCKAVLEFKSSHRRARALLSHCYLARGYIKEAEEHAKIYLERTFSLSAWTLMGLIAEASMQVQEAETSYHKALSVEDIGEWQASSRTRAILARFYIRQEQNEKAKGLLREALRIDKRNALAYHLRAQIYWREQKLEIAKRDLATAYKVSDDLLHLIHYGRILEQQGSTKECQLLRAKIKKEIEDNMRFAREAYRPLALQVLRDDKSPESAARFLSLALEEAKQRKDAVTLQCLAEARKRNSH